MVIKIEILKMFVIWYETYPEYCSIESFKYQQKYYGIVL